MVINSPIERLDIPGLCDRVLVALQQSAAGVVVCDVERLPADAVAVDALARLQLTARRRGGCIRVVGASEELRDLIAFSGLCEVLPAT